jgi:hypothetical protein
MEQIFNIAQRQREPNIKHHRQADNLGAGFEVLEWGAFGHGRNLRKAPATLKPSSSDMTP